MVISVVVVVVMVVMVVIVMVVVVVVVVDGVGVVDVVDIVVVVGMIELPPDKKKKSKFWFISRFSRINRHSCYFHIYSLGVLLITYISANLLIFTEVSLTA